MNISGADFEYGEALLSSVGEVDPKTDKLTLYTVPKGMPPIGGFGDVDNNGNAWFGSGHGELYAWMRRHISSSNTRLKAEFQYRPMA